MLGATTMAMAQQGGLAQEGRDAGGVQSPLNFDDLIEYSIERLEFEGGALGADLSTTVTLGDQVVTLDLAPHSLRAADFQVLVQQEDGSMKRFVPPAPTTYRGAIEGMPGSTVNAAFFEGSLSAVIDLAGNGENLWIVQPLKERVMGMDAALHVVHREEDDISAIGGICGTPNDALGGLMPPADPGAPGVDETLVLELAVDTDFEFFQLRGSEASVISAAEAQVNSVSAIYERDVDTTIEITTIIVRPTSADPYTTSDGGGLLQQMTNHWRTQQTGVRRDTASLISGRDFSGGVLGVAWLSGTCTTTLGYNVNQYRNLGSAARVAVLAHEIGHNNTLQHCSGSGCRIMCAGIGGCSGIITSFGSSSRTIMRSFLERARCIDPAVTEPDPQPLPFIETFDDGTTLDPDRWAEANAVQVTPSVVNPVSAPNALTFQVDGSVTTTRYDVPSSTPIYVNIWSQHRFVEVGKFLRVEYFSTFTGDWEPLGAIQSDGTNQTQFIYNEFRLPLEAAGDQFRLRITSVGADTADAWFVDSIGIDEFCRVDLNRDGTVNLFDFLSFQTFFDQGRPEADFNNDTVLNVFDFLEFQNQFGAGCS
jgi:hypothetical protein